MAPTDIDHALTLAPDEAASALLAAPEGQWFERKSGRIRPSDFAIPLVALANAEGGVIAVGLHDGAITGVTPDAENALRQAAADFTAPPVRATVERLVTGAGVVLLFRVAPGPVVHETHKGECYQRIGDESRRLGFAQRQELEWDRGVASFDGTPITAPTDTTPLLDPDLLKSLKDLLGSSTPDLALRARDLLTVDGSITTAAYLLLADRPQALFPSAHVRVLRYLSDDRGTGRNQSLMDGGDRRCEGPIPEQIRQARTAISELLPRRRALGTDGRFEGQTIIPEDVWLEGLVNAVIHRSYSIGGDHVRVEIFPNRIEITSPGRFPGSSDPRHPESISRNARNPRIARVCADLGITQELGEGIRRMFDEMRRVGLTDPVYLQTPEAVRLTLLSSNAVPNEVATQVGPTAMEILDSMRLAQRPLGTGQVVELTGLGRPTVLRHLTRLREAGLISWDGLSPRDPRATWRVR